jgi:flagellin
MSVINTNVASLIAQNSLGTANSSLDTSLQRLSTGLKINSGADDPAGYIASEDLQSEQAGLNQAISNANRADNVIGTAAGGLNEVSSLLTQLQSLVGESANTGGLSSSEISANQLQVNSILNTINRISNSTSFDGTQLLNGNLGYTTSAAATSAFSNVTVNAATLVGNATTAVVVQVTNSATVGTLKHTTTTSALGGSAVTVQITGSLGTEQLSFAASSTYTQIAAAINGTATATGVTASANGATLAFKAQTYGSANYVSVQNVSGTFAITGGSSGKAFGKDAAVNVNGAAAQVSGLNVSYQNSSLDLNLTLTTGINTGAKSKTFGITGGGATFNVGSTASQANKASIGIGSVATGSLGDSVNGYLSSLASGGANSLTSGNLTTAQTILNEAVNQVATLNGRLGAFQTYTIGSTIASLNVAYENASSAESAIADTDFASETSNLTRAQILQQSATTVLAQANANPQEALKLLQGA